jgi:TonB family protein
MNSEAITESWILSSTPDDSRGLGQFLLSLMLGTGFTLCLFLGIAHFEKKAPEQLAPELNDLRLAVLPIEPPPLPATTTEAAPEYLPMAGFELSPSESPVKIAVSPPSLMSILPEDLSKAPPANAQVNLRLTDFKPRMDLLEDSQHIFQRSEVDRVPAVLDRPNPRVSSRIRDNAQILRVTLMVVIGTNGEIGKVRLTKSSGNPEFDALMAEAIKEWIFSPAIKGGRKVRCLIEQKISVQWKEGNPFQL